MWIQTGNHPAISRARRKHGNQLAQPESSTEGTSTFANLRTDVFLRSSLTHSAPRFHPPVHPSQAEATSVGDSFDCHASGGWMIGRRASHSTSAAVRRSTSVQDAAALTDGGDFVSACAQQSARWHRSGACAGSDVAGGTPHLRKCLRSYSV